MKKFLVFPFIFLLSGCIYSFSDNCIRPLIATVSNNCEKNKGKIYPRISRYQKPYSLGKTDPQQRWKDVVACGGKYGDYENASTDKLIPVLKKDLFYECMLNKGYISLTPAQCGYQNPKWDTGKCNL